MKYPLITNEEKITSSIKNLEKAAVFFTPFLEYLRTYEPKVSPEEFRSLLCGSISNLHKWMQTTRAEKNPQLSKLPATPARDALAATPEELASATRVHESTRANPRLSVNFAYSLSFDPSGALIPSPEALEELKDEYTIYGDQTQAEAYKEAQRLCNELNEYRERYGVPLINSPQPSVIKRAIGFEANRPFIVDLPLLLSAIKNGDL